ncbi:hypothetical protein FWK35_00006970 [Aphis craccivora]|uniref:Uncharacterized protein n=1 Tax=Aphis craccivora TaxID=307492 RepID=A0A6G0Z4E1_APHCR|nr:hypothetical protein FWK35_00006970 [Aphis craccivora]
MSQKKLTGLTLLNIH